VPNEPTKKPLHPLRAFRIARGIKLRDLAKDTKMSPASISRIERFEQFPSSDALKRLREYSGHVLSANDFFSHA
jgi:transcriptional regulator with XRE-family HTH domain